MEIYMRVYLKQIDIKQVWTKNNNNKTKQKVLVRSVKVEQSKKSAPQARTDSQQKAEAGRLSGAERRLSTCTPAATASDQLRQRKCE